MADLVRKAVVSDVPAIRSLINTFVGRKDVFLLPRSLNELYDHVENFFVAEVDGQVVGCCALYVAWEDLAEVKALAVSEKVQRKGLGGELLRAVFQEAARLKIKVLFALTAIPGFFLKHGFQRLPKNDLPHKVWGECINCHLFPDLCAEVAVVRSMDGSAFKPGDVKPPMHEFELAVPTEPEKL